MFDGGITTVLFRSGSGVGFSDVLLYSSLIFLLNTLMVVRMLVSLGGVYDSSTYILCLDNYLRATTVAILYCRSSISLTGFRHERPFKV